MAIENFIALLFISVSSASAAPTSGSGASSSCASGNICMIQPLGSTCSTGIPTGTGFEIMFHYFGCVAPWLYDLAIGICVLWVLVGGIQIIISGDNTGWYDRGKNIIIASIVGLLMLIFAPVILRFLNNAFFT